MPQHGVSKAPDAGTGWKFIAGGQETTAEDSSAPGKPKPGRRGRACTRQCGMDQTAQERPPHAGTGEARLLRPATARYELSLGCVLPSGKQALTLHWRAGSRTVHEL